jgi:hypothetical protein
MMPAIGASLMDGGSLTNHGRRTYLQESGNVSVPQQAFNKVNPCCNLPQSAIAAPHGPPRQASPINVNFFSWWSHNVLIGCFGLSGCLNEGPIQRFFGRTNQDRFDQEKRPAGYPSYNVRNCQRSFKEVGTGVMVA